MQIWDWKDPHTLVIVGNTKSWSRLVRPGHSLGMHAAVGNATTHISIEREYEVRSLTSISLPV